MADETETEGWSPDEDTQEPEETEGDGVTWEPHPDPLMQRAIELDAKRGCKVCARFGGANPPEGRGDGCRASSIWQGLQAGIDQERQRQEKMERERQKARAEDPRYADRRDRGIVYVIHQSRIDAPEKGIDLPPGARLVEKIPLSRLTDDCQVMAIIATGENTRKLSEAINVGDHWNPELEFGAGMVITQTFCAELGRVASPLSVRIRDGWLSLPAA